MPCLASRFDGRREIVVFGERHARRELPRRADGAELVAPAEVGVAVVAQQSRQDPALRAIRSSSASSRTTRVETRPPQRRRNGSIAVKSAFA